MSILLGINIPIITTKYPNVKVMRNLYPKSPKQSESHNEDGHYPKG